MGRITFKIDEDLDKEFRYAVAKRKGVYKGVIGESLEEAINAWIASHRKRRR